MSKRKYTKRSAYWDQFGSPEGPNVRSFEDSTDSPPVSAGEAYYVSEASVAKPLYRSDLAKASYDRAGLGGLQGRRGNRIHKTKKNNIILFSRKDLV